MAETVHVITVRVEPDVSRLIELAGRLEWHAAQLRADLEAYQAGVHRVAPEAHPQPRPGGD